MKRKFKLFAIALAFVMMFTISITSDMKVVSAADAGAGAGSSSAAVVDDLDYIGDKYDIDDHVYDVLTLDRLDNMLESKDGDSIIVFGHWSQDTDNASLTAIPAINAAAKTAGIEKIYYFDMNLAGEYGVNIWNNLEYFTDVTSVDAGVLAEIAEAQGTTVAKLKAPAGANSAFKKLNTYYRTALADLVTAGYEDAETQVALFVVNGKTVTGEEPNKVTTYTVKNSVVIDNVADVATEASNIASLLAGVSNETTYSNFDYFNDAAKWQIANYTGEFANYDEFEEGFLLRSVTYYEFMHMLDLAGEHTFLMTGSWCGDSRTAVPLVIKYAHKYDYNEMVYVFDFNLNSRLHGSPRASIVDYTASQVDAFRIAYLGAAMQDKLGEDGFPTGQANNNLTYIENGGTVSGGVLSGTVVTQDFKRYRSPYLAKYNKAEGGVTEAWLHETLEWEIGEGTQVPAGNTDYSDYIGEYVDMHKYPVGAYNDTELYSGHMSETQKALTKYELSLFFGADEIVYERPVANINEDPDSSLDSGCGDDNDPMNNNGSESQLVPYHGTDDYDVSHYDIDVALLKDSSITYGVYESALNQKFQATTVITATANKALSNISLDFRQQEISAISLKVNGDDVALDSSKGNGTGYTRINNNTIDQQKLYVFPSTQIAKDAEFELTVSYEILTIDYSNQATNMGGATDKVHGFNVHTDSLGYSVAGEPFGSTYWYPNNNKPADGATYTVTMYAPANEGWTMVSNGVRKGTQVATSNPDYVGEYEEVVWEVGNNVAGYQMFATFAKNLITMEQSGIHAGYFSYQTPYFECADGRQIPIFAYVESDTYYKYQEQVDRYFGLLPYYIRTLEEAFGAYPGESLGFMFVDIGDGHNGSASWGAIECYDRPIYTYSTLVGENTFVHELVHQWFGDAVRLNNWESLWLNEGFAVFGSDLYYELTNQGDTLHEKWGNLYNEKGTNSQLWAIAPAGIPNESDMFGGAKAAYNRGAMALTVLKDGLGDELFFDVIDAWSHDFQGQAADTEDFIAHVKDVIDGESDVTAADIDSWAEAWLYGTEKPAAFTLTGVAAGSGDDNQGGNQGGSNDNNQGGSNDDNQGGSGDSDDDEDKGGLGIGAIIGIVAGAVVVVGGVAAFIIIKKRK